MEYFISISAAEKRFESVYDLVADGIIHLYIEANAKDYIDHMSFNVPEPVPETQNSQKESENEVDQVRTFEFIANF